MCVNLSLSFIYCWLMPNHETSKKKSQSIDFQFTSGFYVVFIFCNSSWSRLFFTVLYCCSLLVCWLPRVKFAHINRRRGSLQSLQYWMVVAIIEYLALFDLLLGTLLSGSLCKKTGQVIWQKSSYIMATRQCHVIFGVLNLALLLRGGVERRLTKAW